MEFWVCFFVLIENRNTIAVMKPLHRFYLKISRKNHRNGHPVFVVLNCTLLYTHLKVSKVNGIKIYMPSRNKFQACMGYCNTANTKIPGFCEHVWFIITNLKYFWVWGHFFVLGDKFKLHYENRQKIYKIMKMSAKSVNPARIISFASLSFMASVQQYIY